MIISKQEPPYTPVTIILESAAEFRCMNVVIDLAKHHLKTNSCYGLGNRDVIEFIDSIKSKLSRT